MKGEGKIFSNKSDVSSAYEHGQVDLHAKIKVRIGRDVAETTVGRTLLSLVIPEEVPFKSINRHLKKKQMIELIDTSYRNAGSVKTVTMLDELKRIGYQYATEAGFSISMDCLLYTSDAADE